MRAAPVPAGSGRTHRHRLNRGGDRRPSGPRNRKEPVKYWISNLPADIPARDLVRLAKLRRRIQHYYRELKTTLGTPWQPYGNT